MATTVEITLGDDGKITVGIAEAASTDLDDAQQVASLDEALKMAAHLLQNPPADTDQQPGEAPDASQAGAPAAPDAGQSAADMWQQEASKGQPIH